jgi:hypothetical protein
LRFPPEAVAPAFEELERGGFVVRSRDRWLWVVHYFALQHAGSLESYKFRKGLEQRLSGVPADLASAFRARYLSGERQTETETETETTPIDTPTDTPIKEQLDTITLQLVNRQLAAELHSTKATVRKLAKKASGRASARHAGGAAGGGTEPPADSISASAQDSHKDFRGGASAGRRPGPFASGEDFAA